MILMGLNVVSIFVVIMEDNNDFTLLYVVNNRVAPISFNGFTVVFNGCSHTVLSLCFKLVVNVPDE